MSASQVRLLYPAVTAWVLLVIAGCLPPEYWRTFEGDSTRGFPPAESAPLPIPEAYLPRLTEPATPAAPASGEAWELSLEQAVMLALGNNRDLRVRQLDPVIAGTFEQLERGNYDPELFAQVEYARERSSQSSGATGERFGVETTDTTVTAGVRQPLPSGTTLEVSTQQARSTTDRAPDQQATRLGLSVTQALLRGFGSQVNLASVRQAELGTLASVHELRGFTEALLADVELAYWRHVLAVREIAIFEQSLAVARQQLDEIEQRIEVGLLPEVEAAAARAEVARRRQALLFAQSSREERQLRLLRLLGHDLAGPAVPELRPASEPELEPLPIDDLDDRLALAERSRADLAEAHLRLEQDRLETIVTRNGVLPRLELFLDLGRTGYADTLADSVRELGGGTYDFTAGARLSHLLGDRSANARHAASRATLQQANEAIANLRDLVRLDVRLAATVVERTRQQIAASAVTRGFQEETLLAEQERFAVGASTALLVAQAQRDLLVSEIAEIEAIVNHRIALTEMYRAEGSLLERRGVSLSGTPSR